MPVTYRGAASDPPPATHGSRGVGDAWREPMIDLLDMVWDSIIELGAGLDEAQWKTPERAAGLDGAGQPQPHHRHRADDAGRPHPRQPAGPDRPHAQPDRRDERALGRALPRPARRRGARRVPPAERRSGWPSCRALPPERFDEIGPTPVGQGAVPRVPGRAGHGLVDPRAGHAPGPGPARPPRRPGGRPLGGPPGQRPCRSWWARRWPPPTAPRWCSTSPARPAPPRGRGRPLVVAVVVDGGPRWSTTAPTDPTCRRWRMDLATFVALATGRWRSRRRRSMTAGCACRATPSWAARWSSTLSFMV